MPGCSCPRRCNDGPAFQLEAVTKGAGALRGRRAIPSVDSFLTGSLSTAYTDAVPGWRRRSEEVVTEPGSSLDTRTAFRGSVRAGTLLTRRRSPACLVYYSPYSRSEEHTSELQSHSDL